MSEIKEEGEEELLYLRSNMIRIRENDTVPKNSNAKWYNNQKAINQVFKAESVVAWLNFAKYYLSAISFYSIKVQRIPFSSFG